MICLLSQQIMEILLLLFNDDLNICLVMIYFALTWSVTSTMCPPSTPVTCLRLTTHPRLLLAVRCTTWYASEGERHTKDFQSNLGPFNELQRIWSVLRNISTTKPQKEILIKGWRQANKLTSSPSRPTLGTSGCN